MADRVRSWPGPLARKFRDAGHWAIPALLVALAGGCASNPPPPMTAVSGFEAERYIGEWHQVAAIPAWFQSHCTAEIKANYALADDGVLKVLNSCETADGTLNEAEARARFVDGRFLGKLEVTFVEAMGLWLWPAAGDYWIIGLDEDYQWAVVGEPARKYAWVLARSRSLDADVLQNIERILDGEGYDSCDLLLTTAEENGRLCDLTA